VIPPADVDPAISHLDRYLLNYTRLVTRKSHIPATIGIFGFINAFQYLAQTDNPWFLLGIIEGALFEQAQRVIFAVFLAYRRMTTYNYLNDHETNQEMMVYLNIPVVHCEAQD
jgi:hypothetical protein